MKGALCLRCAAGHDELTIDVLRGLLDYFICIEQSSLSCEDMIQAQAQLRPLFTWQIEMAPEVE